MTLREIELITPFSRGSTEVFKTGLWSPQKPLYVEKTSPCRQGCPIGIDIARAFACASKGKIDEALNIYRQDNPLPGICGRVCYHPCELNCNRKDFDQALNIRGFERFLSDHGRVDLKKEAPTCSRKERVAVIGSGPAGLSCAYHLARLGFPVTILETLPEPGGMLRYGIPEYRLPREILHKEIGFIRQLGVEIRTGVRVGRDHPLVEIKNEYQAVFIAAGAHEGIRLGIEGEDLPGVLEGIKFLREFNLGKKAELGKRVAVIGGGNTAIDCARTARRLGADPVAVIYRRSRAEMPALSEDVAALEREGIKIEVLLSPMRLIQGKGRLSGMECIRMRLGAANGGGRPSPFPIKGTEFIIPIDTVIMAVGQVPEAAFAQEAGLGLKETGVIEISPGTAATNVEGVFAGGDSVGGKAFVADAIAGGKLGALAVFCFLEGKDMGQEIQKHQIGIQGSFSFQHFMGSKTYPVDLKKIVPFDKIDTLCFPYGSRHNNPEALSAEEGLKAFGEVLGGVPPARMEEEISRCFKCGTCTQCDLCFLTCPDLSIRKAGKDGYSLKREYCKGCGICVSTCPGQVIEMGNGR